MAQPIEHAAARSRPALKLVKTQDLPREDWLAIRKQGIGSSDAAAAVGLNPYKSQLELWMEKTNRDQDLPQIDPQDETSPAYWGTLLEPIVAAHYTKRTGHRVRRINAVLQHPTEPWLLANIDREVLGDESVQLLECKTAGLNGARLWKEGGVPEYVQLQVMHQLAVTGKRAADVAVLICGQELQIHRIERDESMIRNLVQLERAFWGYVVRDEAPPVDGSESADQALRALYPRDTGKTIDLSGDGEMCTVFADLLSVRGELADAQVKEAQLKQRIQQRMGDATRATFAGGNVTWKRSKDSSAIDLDRLLQDQPKLGLACSKVIPGSRRFLVNV